MATVFIPNVLQRFSDGLDRIEVEGRTLRQVFANLESKYPSIKGQIIEDEDIRPGLAIVVDNEITGQGLIQPVEPDSEIRILPAIGGG
jgi:molybdopterin converting factor small subunit